MIRKFFLQNEYGIRKDLNSIKEGVLVNPSGLGYEINTSYTEIGDSFIRNYFKEKQQAISAKILFVKKQYETCKKFIDFVNNSNKLTLIYKTNAGEYLRDVDIVSFTKTEISENNFLECDIKMLAKSLFYSNYVDKFLIDRVKGEMRWDFRWDARFNDYGIRKINIDNKGHVAAPFTLELFGYCEYPVMILKKDKKELYKTKFDTILQQGEKINYSSVDGNLYCYRVNRNGEEENFADKLDINSTNFFKFPVGHSEIEFTSNTGANNNTLLTVFNFYRSV